MNNFSWVVEGEIAGMARPYGRDESLWPWLADKDIALVVCLTALGVHMHVGHEVTAQLSPQLDLADLDAWMARLVRAGRALVDAERARRLAATQEPAA